MSRADVEAVYGSPKISFGRALEALKQGKRVARAGWNGKGMFVSLEQGRAPAIPYPSKTRSDGVGHFYPHSKMVVVDTESEACLLETIGGVSWALFQRQEFAKNQTEEAAKSEVVMPHLVMRAADGSRVPGWLASQTDMLAEDWEVVA